MDNNPVVSVLTTCYNRADYVAETIESVLAQSFANFEYIIVDDGSTDGSFDVIRDYAKKDSRIQAYQNESNLGDYPNRNKAASYASGTYLKYIDSDDLLYPHALDVCVRCMQQYPEAALGLVKLHTEELDLPAVAEPSTAYREHFFCRGFFENAPGSAIIRRAEFESLEGFSGKRYIGDFEFWLRIAALHSTVLIPGFLGWTRTHEGQELNFDPLLYAELVYSCSMTALLDATCPLTEDQTQESINRLRHGFARYSILRPAIRDRRISLRRDVMKRNGFSVFDVVRSAFKKIDSLPRYSQILQAGGKAERPQVKQS